MSTKISFIIPVYNVEKYLNECVNSILAQLTDDCEIILVDDGSTDSSGRICDEFSGQNTNIRVLHQKNSGHSAARNVGLKMAVGKYVSFIDSDDYIGQGCVKEILNWIKAADADICFMEGYKLFPDGTTKSLGDEIDRSQISGKNQEEVFQHLATRPKYPGSACTKLFRREFLMENELKFPTDLTHAEDLTLCLNCFLKAERFDALPCPFYYYRQNREGSMTSKISSSSFHGLSSFVSNFADSLTDKQRKPHTKITGYAMAFVAYEYSILLWEYSRLNVAEKNDTKEFLQDYKWVLSYGASKKTELIQKVVRILGVDLTAKLLDVYMRNR